MSKKVPAAAVATPTAPAVKAPRGSRLPVNAVLAALTASGPAGLTVPALAAALAAPERDIRLSIDKLRALKYPVVRAAKLTFALAPSA